MLANPLFLVDVLYDCVGSTFDTEQALDALRSSFDDSGIVLATIDTQSGAYTDVDFVNVPSEVMNLFEHRYNASADNIALEHFTALPECTPAIVRQLISEGDYQQHPMIKELSIPYGIHSEILSVLQKGSDFGTFCTYVRHKGQPGFDSQAVEAIEAANRHLRLALMFQQRLNNLEKAATRLGQVLDIVEFGVVLFGSTGRPSFVNVAARNIFNDNRALELRAEGIRFKDASAGKRFDMALRKLSHGKAAFAASANDTIPVASNSKTRPLHLMIVPLPPHTNVDFGAAEFAVLMFDAEKKRKTAIRLFTSSYQLTPAEARLVMQLAEGVSLDDIAERRDITRNTAKSQLHSVFAKTGTSRQSELVSMVLRSAAGISVE